jgi:hypothetical protein
MVLLLGRTLISWSLAIDERGGHEDLRGSGHRSIIRYVHGRIVLYCSSLPFLCEPETFSRIDPAEVAFARAFYNSWSGNYNESRGPTDGLGAGQTLYCRAQRLGVVNDVFNGVGMHGLIACHPALDQWYDVVPLHHEACSGV